MTSGIAIPMKVDVATAGELVVLQMGNFGVSMHFVDALKLSLDLLARGREARHIQLGRYAKLVPSFRSLGDLTNASPEYKRPGRWVGKPPPLMKLEDMGVRLTGHTVQLRFRKAEAAMSWDAALTIAQHLRVKGKAARDSVKEKAPWIQLAES